MKRKIVAITGGIGSGKSTVMGIIRDKGYATIDCDTIAKTVAQDSQVISLVQNLLGNDAVTNGQLNRPYIRSKVFTDDQLLNKYNEIFFGRVRQLLQQQIDSISGDVFVEIPVFDAFSFNWDEVWVVQANSSLQVSRVVKRDNVDQQNVLNVISKQSYPSACTRIITNDGSLESLSQQIRQLI